MFKEIFALLLVFSGVIAYEYFPRKCEDYKVKPVQNFNFTRFVGLWYEIERYYRTEEAITVCATSDYELKNNKLSVVNTVVKLPNCLKSFIRGTVSQTYPKLHDGNLQVVFDEFPGTYNYLVVDTDYNSYSVLWSCKKYNNTHSEQNLWTNGRNTMLTTVTENVVNGIMKEYGFTGKLYITDNNPTKCHFN